VDSIKTKSIEELSAVEGMNIKAAESVYNYFYKRMKNENNNENNNENE
jgi:ERCC4-type nuclease